jgi:diaminopimelate decarboxylase
MVAISRAAAQLLSSKGRAHVDALDTPAVLVDLTLAERNIERLMQQFRGGPVSVRPHLKTVKSSRFAELFLAAGASGVCVAKLSEAEVMAAAGIEDILITTELAGAPKLVRAVELLAAHPKVTLVVDSAAGADALSAVLSAAGLTVMVLLDLDVGQRRCGVPPEAAPALAAHIARLPALRLVGVQGYEGHLQHVLDAGERNRLCREAMARLTGAAAALRADGHDIRRVTTGGTGTPAPSWMAPRRLADRGAWEGAVRDSREPMTISRAQGRGGSDEMARQEVPAALPSISVDARELFKALGLCAHPRGPREKRQRSTPLLEWAAVRPPGLQSTKPSGRSQ